MAFMFGASVIGNASGPGVGTLYVDAVGVSWNQYDQYVIGRNRIACINIDPRDFTGEHKATYTFSSADPDPATAGWTLFVNNEGIPLPGSIWPAYLDHQTVLGIHAGSGTSQVAAACSLGPTRLSGTIELWLALEGDTGTYAIEAGGTSNNRIDFLAIGNGQLSIPSEAGPYPFAMDTWHHLRLDFAGPGQAYLGLGENEYRLVLDQQPLGIFTASADLALDYFGLALQNTEGTGVGRLYLDAVGLSWDPAYQIGDNLQVCGPPARPVVNVTYGDANAALLWVPGDVNTAGGSYEIYCDGSLSPVAIGEWESGEAISWPLAYLLPGTHEFEIIVSDGLGGVASTSVTVNVAASPGGLLAMIDALIAAVQSSDDADWRNPAECRKQAMVQKLEAIKDLIEAGDYAEAYDAFLHDIKPKLTGLKTDENEDPWGHGFFHCPWVMSLTLHQEFKELINPILQGLSLENGTTPPPDHHGCHCHSHHHACGHPSSPHWGYSQSFPNHCREHYFRGHGGRHF